MTDANLGHLQELGSGFHSRIRFPFGDTSSFAVGWYKHLFQFRAKIDPARYHCIDYRELVRDPGAAIEQAYSHFGWPVSEAMRTRLKDATRRQGEFKSQHEYTLEEFGLSKQWIQDELGELLDHYKLER